MSLRSAVSSIALGGMLVASLVSAADLPDDTLTTSGRTTVTLADYAAELRSVPAEHRAEFSGNAQRVSKLVNNLVETKTLAAEARVNGLDKDPDVQRRVALAVDKVLAVVRAEQVERDAIADFDRRPADYAARAQELYAVNKGKYTLPERVHVAHILVRIEARGKEEARKLAEDIRARAAAAGADFGALARELSEDRNAKKNSGDLGWLTRQNLDPAFATAAFALTKPGELSQPILSASGYHIIRFEGRKPAESIAFAEAKDRIYAEMRRQYVTDKKNAMMDGIFRDPTLRINQPAIDGLVGAADPEAGIKAGAAVAK